MTRRSQPDNARNPKIVAGEEQNISLQEIDVLLSVFQVPSGEYRLSKSQILEVIDEPKNWLSRLRSATPEIFKVLKAKGFTGHTLKVRILHSHGSSLTDTLSIPDARRVWGHFARKGNNIALDILEACSVETIEHRANKVFSIKRTEEDYNQRLAIRTSLRKEKYQAFTSAIAAWERKLGIYNTTVGKQWFRRAHDQINLRLQDLRSRQIKRVNDLPDWALIRDYFDAPVLVDYSSVSQLSANFLKMGARDPVEAVNLACDCYLPDTYSPMPAEIVENIQKVGRRLAKMKRQAS
ncbi:hypothetical protein ACN4EK_16350 [Pantanalinema rosaneae CENA516]|uniref:hypothetical protein n=1 Tax=Pantanalinema rosaneae TaxID=1620701 RepID=UPI003D6FB21E